MKKIFLVTFSTALASLLIGCGGGSGNSNNANTNAGSSPTANSNANSNSVAQSTPLPEYTDAETAFADGNKFFDANRTELAVEAYSQAVKLNPEFAEAWFKLGVSHALIEKEKEIEAFNEEVEETPTPSRKVRKDAPVARTKDSEKAFEKAVAAYKKITAKDPKNDLAFFNLGRSYDKLDEDEDAEKALRQAVKLKEDDTLYQTEFGAILVKLARYDEAVKALKKAIELDPENSAAEELLEKAEAGKRRVNFGTTPKPQQQNDPSKSSKSSKSTEDDPSNENTKPGTTPEKTDKKPEKKPEQPKKLGKTGDQRH